jgi:putative membrane protein
VVVRRAKSDDALSKYLVHAGTDRSQRQGAGEPDVSKLPQTNATLSESASPRAAPIADRFEVRVTADSHFAWLRTRLSVERTLMSWVRTAVSLIGFGFAIVQFFDRIQQIPGVIPARFPDAPRYLGLALIFCGILGLVISIWEYRWTLRYLWGGSFTPLAGMTKERMQTPIVAVAILLMFIGMFAFFAVLLRLM